MPLILTNNSNSHKCSPFYLRGSWNSASSLCKLYRVKSEASRNQVASGRSNYFPYTTLSLVRFNALLSTVSENPLWTAFTFSSKKSLQSLNYMLVCADAPINTEVKSDQLSCFQLSSQIKDLTILVEENKNTFLPKYFSQEQETFSSSTVRDQG